LVLGAAAFAQSERGSMTGVVADPAGAVVANGMVEARNAATSALYQVATTATGNYTIGEMVPGTYELSITVPGFKKYVRPSLTLLAGQILRIDATLEVGAASESVTVNEAPPLLNTESGELSHNVSGDRMNDVPILTVSTNIRNPLTVTELLPGTYFVLNAALPTLETVRINGTPTNSERLWIVFLGLGEAYFPGTHFKNTRLSRQWTMSENQRDTAGRFLPGVNGRRTGVTVEARRTALLKLAKELAEKYPLADLE
jgi:hypothetical protein